MQKINKAMNEQEEKELFQEDIMRSELLSNFSSEDLIHVDNIITGINKLKESKSASTSVWMMIVLWILGVPTDSFNGIMVPNRESDEQGSKAGESNPME